MSLFQRTPHPVLAPLPHLPWASGAVFNPGAWRDPSTGVTHLVFRAIPAGYRKESAPNAARHEGQHRFTDYVSYLGHATSTDGGLTFDVRETPLVAPDTDADRYGAEDARIVCLDDVLYLTYTALRAPAFGDEDGIGIGLAASTDGFRTVERFGMIGPDARDKDAVLFPRRINGKIAMLHRIVPDIQIATFDDHAQLRAPGAAYWERHLATLDAHTVLRPEAPWEGKKVGAGPPPVETPDGWLLLYHAADERHVYRAGLALLDLDDPQRVIARLPYPVFEPETDWEREGDVPNVVFPEGLTLDGDALTVFYGAADRCIGRATASLADLLAALSAPEARTRKMPRVTMLPAGPDGPGPFPRTAPVEVERMHGGRPVLSPDPERDWESRVVLNPAAAYLDAADLERLLPRWPNLPGDAVRQLRDAGGAAVLLYRAQGEAFVHHGHHASSLGLALCTPNLEVVYRHPEPVLAPDAPFHNLGVEDPRCTRVGDTFYLYYTGYTTAPPEGGWTHTGDGHPALYPDDEAQRRVQICLATSDDLFAWTTDGPVRGGLNATDNKNAVLFPEPVRGRWYLLHRPLDGPAPMAVHYATADAPEGPWRSHGLLFASERYADFAASWVGSAGPPVPLGDGRFATVYHQGHYDYDGRKLYNLSAALLAVQPDGTLRVEARIEPLLVPTGAAERDGDPLLGVDNVVFSCANYRLGDDLIVPYAGADSRIFGARIPFAPLVEALEARAAVTEA